MDSQRRLLARGWTYGEPLCARIEFNDPFNAVRISKHAEVGARRTVSRRHLYLPAGALFTWWREGRHWWNVFENQASAEGQLGGIVNGSVCPELMRRVFGDSESGA